MLGKLIKYEFKATGRTFLPLYGAILIVALVQRFLGRSSQELFEELNRIGDFATIALVALFMALGVITLVVTIQRFQKSLLSDEGYLMFTLPVKTRSLIASKMVVATTWVILSGVVGIISCFILFANKEFFTEFLPLLSEMIMQMKEILQDESGRTATFLLISGFMVGFLNYIQFVLVIYLSLAIGQFPKFQKHRTAASFIAFFVINVVLSWIIGFIGFQVTPDQFPEININMALLFANVVTILMTVGLFEATNYILNRHLNLE